MKRQSTQSTTHPPQRVGERKTMTASLTGLFTPHSSPFHLGSTAVRRSPIQILSCPTTSRLFFSRKCRMPAAAPPSPARPSLTSSTSSATLAAGRAAGVTTLSVHNETVSRANLCSECPAVQRVKRGTSLSRSSLTPHTETRSADASRSLCVSSMAATRTRKPSTSASRSFEIRLPVQNTAESFKFIQHNGDTNERCVQQSSSSTTRRTATSTRPRH